MENSPFIDDFPVKTSIYKGFSMAMLNNQMIWLTVVTPVTNRDSWGDPPSIRSVGFRVNRTWRDNEAQTIDASSCPHGGVVVAWKVCPGMSTLSTYLEDPI